MPDDKEPRKDDESKAWAQAAEGWTLALTFPLSILAGYLLGFGADKLFHSSPWGQIIGAVLGIAAAFVTLFRIGMRNGGGT